MWLQVDRLQTDIQERDLASGQQEALYKSDVADREEEISRMKAEINVLHEQLAQFDGQVSVQSAVFGFICVCVCV